MSEGEPRDIHQTATWAVDRIAQRMEQTPVPLHLANGIEGHGFKVIDPENEDDARTIALFPGEHIVTISTPDVSIKIKNATASPAKDGVTPVWWLFRGLCEAVLAASAPLPHPC